MLDQRLFLQAANHFRAGRISINDFQKKVYDVQKKQPTQVVIVAEESTEKDDLNLARKAAQDNGAKVTLVAASGIADDQNDATMKAADVIVLMGGSAADFDAVGQSDAGAKIFVPTATSDLNGLFASLKETGGQTVVMPIGAFQNAGALAAKIGA